MAEESRALQAKNEAGWDLHGLRTASQRTAKSKHQVVSNSKSACQLLWRRAHHELPYYYDV